MKDKKKKKEEISIVDELFARRRDEKKKEMDDPRVRMQKPRNTSFVEPEKMYDDKGGEVHNIEEEKLYDERAPDHQFQDRDEDASK